MKAYNEGVLFGNNPGAMSHEIVLLGLNEETEGNAEKSQISVRGKYMATSFLLSSDMRQYGDLILLLKDNYTKQQRNYLRRLTDTYRLMVAFDPKRSIAVAGGRNEGLDFGKVVADSKGTCDGDHGDDGVIGRKLECWRCGGEHLKKN